MKYFLLCFLLQGLNISCDQEKKNTLRYDEQKDINSLFLEEAKTCLANIDICSFKTLQQKTPKNYKNKNTILILDSERQALFSSSFLLLKQKVLEYLTLDSNFYLIQNKASISVPTVLYNISEYLLKNKLKEGLFKKNFDFSYVLLKLHHKIKKKQAQNQNFNHGEYVFFILSKYNPNSKFVIAPYPEPSAKNFCNLANKIKHIQTLLDNNLKSLSKTIKTHNIKLVNLSYSSDIETLKKHNKMICDNKNSVHDLEKYLQMKIQFLDQLSSLHKNTIFIQSIPNDILLPFKPKDRNYDFSCKERPNFFRIGYWSNHFYRVRKMGVNTSIKRLPTNQKKLLLCSNFFINSGISENKATNPILDMNQEFWLIDPKLRWWNDFSLKINYHGFFEVPVRFMSTSWAAPIGLSFIHYIIKKHNLSINENTIFKIKQILHGKLFDPLFNKQFIRYDKEP